MASKNNELTSFQTAALALREANEATLKSNREIKGIANATERGMANLGKAASASGMGLLKVAEKIPGAKLVKLAFFRDAQIEKRKVKKANKLLADQLGLTPKKLKVLQDEKNLIKMQKEQLKGLKEAAESLNLNKEDMAKAMGGEIANLEKAIGKEGKKESIKSSDKSSKVSGAAASEDATELRILNDSMLSEQEKQTALLELIAGQGSDAKKDAEKSSGGIFGSIGKMGKTIMTAVGAIGASLLTLTGLPALKKLIFGPKVDKPLKTPKVPKNVPTVGRDAKGRFTKLPAKPPVKPPVKMGSMLKNVGKIALKGAKFLPVVGLAVTAISGLWDGFTAGMKEAENENSTGLTIAREATAGVLSGLTFGLIDQETISSKMTGIADGITGVASSVKNKITDIAASATEKFTEAKDSAIALGLSVKDKITSIPIPTFAEASESLYNFGTGFASAIGIPVPSFDDAKASLTAMGTSLTAGFTSLFGDEDGSFSFASVSKGVTGLAGGYFQKITDIWNSITDIFPSWEEIKKMLPSPKKILSMLTFGLIDDDEKFDAGDYISRSEVKSLVASAVTKALQEQSMMNSTAAANAPFMFMQGANQNTTVVNNVSKPIMIPTPPSNPNDSWWNVSNLF